MRQHTKMVVSERIIDIGRRTSAGRAAHFIPEHARRLRLAGIGTEPGSPACSRNTSPATRRALHRSM